MSDQTLLKPAMNKLKDKKESPIAFTKREAECVQQGTQSKNLSQIAESLGISKRSVCFYMAGIRKKCSMLMLQM